MTSSKRISLTSPDKTAPYTAAPIATASSGFTPLLGYFPKNYLTISWTLGTLVIPPTRSTSSILSFVKPESFRQASKGGIVLYIKLSHNDSNLALVNVT